MTAFAVRAPAVVAPIPAHWKDSVPVPLLAAQEVRARVPSRCRYRYRLARAQAPVPGYPKFHGIWLRLPRHPNTKLTTSLLWKMAYLQRSLRVAQYDCRSQAHAHFLEAKATIRHAKAFLFVLSVDLRTQSATLQNQQNCFLPSDRVGQSPWPVHLDLLLRTNPLSFFQTVTL